ncbi:F-box/LRR-repeat protein 13 [Bienertia sinuspersici]
MRNVIDQNQVIIDAPKLTYLYVICGGPVIDFVKDPTVLDTADIDLTYWSFLSMLEEGNPLANMTYSVMVVPRLILNNLDYVNIIGLQGNNDEVNLVGYILKNATGLNYLYILVNVDNVVEDEDARVGKEFKFCKDFFRLPMTSSTTRVVFSDQYVGASNDTATSHN